MVFAVSLQITIKTVEDNKKYKRKVLTRHRLFTFSFRDYKTDNCKHDIFRNEDAYIIIT